MLCETPAMEALSAASVWVNKVDIVRGDYHALAFVRITTNSARVRMEKVLVAHVILLPGQLHPL